MSHEDRPLQIERVNDRHYVIAKAICRAIRCRITGGTEPTPDNTVDMVVSRELRHMPKAQIDRNSSMSTRSGHSGHGSLFSEVQRYGSFP